MYSDVPGRASVAALALLLSGIPLQAQDGAAAARGSVRLAFVGDILLDGSVGRTIAAHGVHYPWQDAALAFQRADLVVGNLEMAITTGGDEESKQFTFRGPPRVLDGLVEAGVDLVTLANNHSLDYGARGLLDTVRHLDEAGIAHVGAGADFADAHRPHVVELNGLRIGFLGFSRVYPYAHWVASRSRPGVASGYDYALEGVLRAVAETRPTVDALILLVHWGSELADYPRDIDLAFVEALKDAGVTAVIGHHPHVLQGVEWNDSLFVAYSLGNFVFGSFRETTRMTGVLELTLGSDGRVSGATFLPMMISDGRPLLARGPQAAEVLERVRELSRLWHTLVLEDGRITTRDRLLVELRPPLSWLRFP